VLTYPRHGMQNNYKRKQTDRNEEPHHMRYLHFCSETTLKQEEMQRKNKRDILIWTHSLFLFTGVIEFLDKVAGTVLRFLVVPVNILAQDSHENQLN